MERQTRVEQFTKSYTEQLESKLAGTEDNEVIEFTITILRGKPGAENITATGRSWECPARFFDLKESVSHTYGDDGVNVTLIVGMCHAVEIDRRFEHTPVDEAVEDGGTKIVTDVPMDAAANEREKQANGALDAALATHGHTGFASSVIMTDPRDSLEALFDKAKDAQRWQLAQKLFEAYDLTKQARLRAGGVQRSPLLWTVLSQDRRDAWFEVAKASEVTGG